MLNFIRVVVVLDVFLYCTATPTGSKMSYLRSIEDAPWTVIVERENELWLLGAIVGPNVAVSVTRPINHIDPTIFNVRAGSSQVGKGGSTHNITKVLTHPLATLDAFDVGLIFVDPPFTLDNTRQIIELNRNMDREGEVEVPTFSSNGELVLMHEKLVDFDQCYYWYEIIGGLDDTQGCMTSFNGTGPCYDDVGTAVVQNGSLVGVLSESFPICDDAEWPITFSNFTNPFLSMWLTANVS